MFSFHSDDLTECWCSSKLCIHLFKVIYNQYLPNSHVSPVNGFLQLHEHVVVSKVPPLAHRLPTHGAVKEFANCEKQKCLLPMFCSMMYG